MLGERIPVLDHGFIKLLDVMGCDTDITAAARVSTGSGSKGPESDARLLRYLWENKHHTPFEMCEMKFHVRAPIFVARQWFRHRAGSYNEMSARYQELPCDYYVPSFWRKQGRDNKQTSGGEVEYPRAGRLFDEYDASCLAAVGTYNYLLSNGVAREQARMVLPVSVYTEFYFKMDLRNLLHFLQLRCDEHAQWEIQQYAKVIDGLVRERFPVTWEVANERSDPANA